MRVPWPRLPSSREASLPGPRLTSPCPPPSGLGVTQRPTDAAPSPDDTVPMLSLLASANLGTSSLDAAWCCPLISDMRCRFLAPPPPQPLTCGSLLLSTGVCFTLRAGATEFLSMPTGASPFGFATLPSCARVSRLCSFEGSLVGARAGRDAEIGLPDVRGMARFSNCWEAVRGDLPDAPPADFGAALPQRPPPGPWTFKNLNLASSKVV